MTKVQGLAEWKRRWGAVPRKVKAAVRQRLEEIAEELVREMRLLAPKDTGAGAAAINWTWGDAPKGSVAIGTVGETADSRLRITIYTAAGSQFHMRFQEFGTVNMAANPYFFPVYRARRRSVRSKITRSISKAVRDA